MQSALVTGGNRGIGRAISELLVARGYHVHVLCRSGTSPPLEETTVWQVDVADYAATLAIAEKIGDFELLVNNAGYMNPKTAVDYDESEILRMLSTNLITAARLSVWFAEKRSKLGGGRVVSLGSIAGEIGHPDLWYGVSKAGLANAMRSLSRSHGRHGLSFFTVAPGPVETDMQSQNDEARKARLRAATIHQRFATAEDVARTVVWLGTEAPEYMTGEVFDMNNGANFR